MYLLESPTILLTIVLYSLLIITNFKYLYLLMGLTIILDVTLILQIAYQGLRWNYIFLYLSGMLLTPILFTLLIKNTHNPHIAHMTLFKITSMIFIVITLVSLYAFPIPHLTTPEGQYSIGTTVVDVTDPSRIEAYGDASNAPRKFVYQVWYPSSTDPSLDKVPWLIRGNVVTKGLARLGKLPEFVLNQLALTTSNASLDAPISSVQEKYPIIILSHGWSSSRLLHVNMAEYLAANGYVVIGIEHAYGSVATAFTDGSVIYFSEKTLPSTDYSQTFLENGNKLIKTFAGDISYVLDALEDFNEGLSGPEVLKGHLDLDKIGLLGHSTGGGAAVLTGIYDDRIKSILAYDPWVEPIEAEAINTGLKVPTLFLRSDEWETGPNNANLTELMKKNKAESILYQVNDTDHSDFTLMYLFSPLTKKLNMLGEIDGDKLSILQGQIDVAFFNQTLLGVNDDTLDKLIDAYRVDEGIYLERVQ